MRSLDLAVSLGVWIKWPAGITGFGGQLTVDLWIMWPLGITGSDWSTWISGSGGQLGSLDLADNLHRSPD
jgi:hypothetical protein